MELFDAWIMMACSSVQDMNAVADIVNEAFARKLMGCYM